MHYVYMGKSRKIYTKILIVLLSEKEISHDIFLLLLFIV